MSILKMPPHNLVEKQTWSLPADNENVEIIQQWSDISRETQLKMQKERRTAGHERL